MRIRVTTGPNQLNVLVGNLTRGRTALTAVLEGLARSQNPSLCLFIHREAPIRSKIVTLNPIFADPPHHVLSEAPAVEPAQILRVLRRLPHKYRV